MPLVRIDVPAAPPLDDRSEIADVIYTALVDVLKAPADDRFMVVTPHDPSHLIIDPHYLGIDRSDAANGQRKVGAGIGLGACPLDDVAD